MKTGYLIDMDGVIYRGKELIKRMLPETLYNRIRETGSRIGKSLRLTLIHG